MKKLFASLFLSIVTLFTVSPIYAQESIPSTANVEPRKDILQWVFKTENGKMYKRLWNASKNRWDSNWILIAG